MIRKRSPARLESNSRVFGSRPAQYKKQLCPHPQTPAQTQASQIKAMADSPEEKDDNTGGDSSDDSGAHDPGVPPAKIKQRKTVRSAHSIINTLYA